MIASDDDGGTDAPVGDRIVERQPGPGALAVTEPADARGQPLPGDLLLRHLDPAGEVLVLREEVHNDAVRFVDVVGIAGERDPAERAFALAEQRADVGRDEAGVGERFRQPVVERALAQVVAVIEDDGPTLLHLDHRRAVFRHCADGFGLIALWVTFA